MACKFKNLENLSKWMNRYRPWIYKKSFGNQNSDFLLKKNDLNFTLMTYNILSEDYLRSKALYSRCPQSVITWPERGGRILDEIEFINPDILCMQEVFLDHYHQLYAPELRKKGYESVFNLREFRFDGCALFFKKNKFNLLKTREVNLHREDLMNILDRPNVGLIAMFEPIENEKKKISNRLIVGTTHILFNMKRGDIKLAQVRLLLAEMEKMSHRQTDLHGKKTYYPFVIAGDFNMLPDSPIYQFLEQGILEWGYLDSLELSGHIKINTKNMTEDKVNIKTISSDTEFVKENETPKETILNSPETNQIIRHHLNLRSVFKSRNKSNKKFITTKHDRACEMVDYIFYHQNKELNLVGFRKLLDTSLKQYVPYLPNEFIGSDHFSLIAKFSLSDRKN